MSNQGKQNPTTSPKPTGFMISTSHCSTIPPLASDRYSPLLARRQLRDGTALPGPPAAALGSEVLLQSTQRWVPEQTLPSHGSTERRDVHCRPVRSIWLLGFSV